MKTEKLLSVSSLNYRIRSAMEDFGTLLVQGELSGLKIAASGHLYATLKDRDEVISVVMWRSSVSRQKRLPKEGELVQARGSLSLYGPRGTYQLVCSRMTAVGEGDLAARFEALKEKLAADGLFEEERKKALPWLPAAVGIATASGSAALADIEDSLRHRFPSMSIIHEPCRVQGTEAVGEIVAAIQFLDEHPAVEVIICGRGGGSLEDLWAFNEEPVVRALAACETPIISAVGHEIDTTLADYAADMRAKTPTEAAHMAVPVLQDIHESLDEWENALHGGIEDLLDKTRQRLEALATHRALLTPVHQINMRQQKLADLEELMTVAMETTLTDLRHKAQGYTRSLRVSSPHKQIAHLREQFQHVSTELERASQKALTAKQDQCSGYAARLHDLSPLHTIARGYSSVVNAAGTQVLHLDDAPLGESIKARVTDGWLSATVTEHERLDITDQKKE